MGDWTGFSDILRIMVRELTLFAALGIFIVGLDDLLIDLLYLFSRKRRRAKQQEFRDLVDGGQGRAQAPLAIFVPAWQESGVIAAMLASCVSAWGRSNYRIYVGSYPNDPATTRAILGIAATLGVATGGPIMPVSSSMMQRIVWIPMNCGGSLCSSPVMT